LFETASSQFSSPGVCSSKALHVLVGVIENVHGEVLVTQRQPGKRFAGYWEFPGGKREPGEQPREALCRELAEELGIVVQVAQPIMCFEDPFADCPILLDVWHVTEFSGKFTQSDSAADIESATARGCEGQPLRWADQLILSQLQFPPANQRIFKRLSLGEFYGITPPDLTAAQYSRSDRLCRLQHYVENYVAKVETIRTASHARCVGSTYASVRPLMQIRAHELCQQEFDLLLHDFVQTHEGHRVRPVVNRASHLSNLEQFFSSIDSESVNLAPALTELTAQQKYPSIGVHLPEHRLRALGEYFYDKLVPEKDRAGESRLFQQLVASHPGVVGASCHSAESVMLAENLGFDYALLSPVKATTSHIGGESMGWDVFREMTKEITLPVFALGGLAPSDIGVAKGFGAQGVAGISAFVGMP
jgi:8-oxo-dGTP diphosphatase